MNRITAPAAALLVLGLLVSSCGDDADEADNASATTSLAPDAATSDADSAEQSANNEDVTPDDVDDPTTDGTAAGDTTTTAPEVADGPETVPTISAPDPDVVIPSSTLPADVGLPPEDERGENEGGVQINLDETASLACANTEFARDAVAADDAAAAIRFLAEAAGRAEPSAVTAIADHADSMRAVTTLDEADAVVTSVLATCVELGHQI